MKTSLEIPYPWNALLEAAQEVVDKWEKGDLAGAVCKLDCAVDMAKAHVFHQSKAPTETADVNQQDH